MDEGFSRSCLATVLIFILSSSMISSFLNVADARHPAEAVQSNAAPETPIQPIIRHEDAIDRDFDGVQDSLEMTILNADLNGSALLPVVVTLYNPVSKRDIDFFTGLSGRVTHVYQHVTYGFAGVIPAAKISRFANLEKQNLCIIERDVPIRYHLDVSVPLMRARPAVWDTYGYTGSSNNSIAIIDTGVDDSHPDIGPFGDLNFSRKIVGWYDATSDNSPTPEDYGEHGTHVAGIAAGTGVANALQGSAMIETTFTYKLPSKPPGPWVYGYVDYIDVMNPGAIDLNCSWSGDNDVLLVLSDPAGNEVKRTSGTTRPLILAYDTTGTSYPTGRYEVFVGNIDGPSGTPFSCKETYPYQGLSDGYNLFTGVAPNSKLVGVKVFDNTGTGYLSNLWAGMDWVIQNRFIYHIVVASMSVGLENGATDTTLDQKADTMVNYGIVTTVSAGNDFPEYTIGSPGTAAYVITVAATNDEDGITSYSSNGDALKNEYGLIKPDVAAPGGTFQPQYGNKIVSADSNDVDASYSGYSDRNVNDYQQMAGTSMSAPHVAGLATLLVQAFGDWNWTLGEALRVKMLLSMTAFETQNGEEGNLPALNRGGKDSVEGYGRVSADAAIEAVTMNYNIGEFVSDTLGSEPSDKKVWARQVSFLADTTYEFHLNVPANADYDLYMYDGKPDSYGQPVILAKSVNTLSGAEETIQYVSSNTGTHFIVVKWVSGSGAFDLTGTHKERDVAVVNVAPSTTEAFLGQELNVTVVVRNEGSVVEAFDVTAYYNTTAIGTKGVTDLAPGADVALTFSWNTAGVSPGTYTIKAEADVVPGEADVADNTCVDGMVEVELTADVDGDGDVDLDDLYYVMMGYDMTIEDAMAVYGLPPGTDIDGDGWIDLDDLYYVLIQYGKTY